MSARNLKSAGILENIYNFDLSVLRNFHCIFFWIILLVTGNHKKVSGAEERETRNIPLLSQQRIAFIPTSV
jgi:hypothetical protein